MYAQAKISCFESTIHVGTRTTWQAIAERQESTVEEAVAIVME